MIRSVIKGFGAYLPERRLTNFDLEKMVDTSDEWIVERTGIRERRIAANDETTGSLAIRAAREALANASLTPNQIDLIILATTTPDETLPATATKVQAALGMTSGFAFDIQAACSGFMYALSVADNYIRTGAIRNALVIGADTLSRIVDWTDRNTCVLFGDGAGAVILSAEEGQGTTTDSGILSLILRSDGANRNMLISSGGVSASQSVGKILMEGREVFRFAVENMSKIAHEILSNNGFTIADVDCLVPHQANIRIIDATCRKLGIPSDKVILTLADQGNTSGASVAMALYDGITRGRIKHGDLLLLETMGAGLTWSAGLIRY
ncbi:MAG: ketoacyl-ACP synthase III [Alphaproteobacteria bacterium]|nr:ketoacyl-ACP synthase III [Alphaproteobacteria bacterium]